MEMILQRNSILLRSKAFWSSKSSSSSQVIVNNLINSNNNNHKRSLSYLYDELKKNGEYEPVIGLEVHAQLNLQTKLFSNSVNKYAARPNSLVSPFDLSLPGSLPSLNSKAVIDAIRTGLALNCVIPYRSSFDRKHYFYADLPNGYQITQQREPIAHSGYIDFIVYDDFHHRIGLQSPSDAIDVKLKRCRLKQIQLEQDSGKSLMDSDESLVDLNRAGVALLEFVFEPELHTTLEVVSLVRELRLILNVLGACSGKLEEGALRVDANISVQKKGSQNDSDQAKVDWSKLGTRTEVKNLNSYRFLQEAIEYEIQRQIGLLRSGETVVQETMAWNIRTKSTFAIRDKEIVQDYRFMPEPNLPPIFIIGGHRADSNHPAEPISDPMNSAHKDSSAALSQSSSSSPLSSDSDTLIGDTVGSTVSEQSFTDKKDEFNRKFSFSREDSSTENIHTGKPNTEAHEHWIPINLSTLKADIERLQLPVRVRRELDAYRLTLKEKHFLVQDPSLRELFFDTVKLYPNPVAQNEKSIFIFDFLYKLTSGLLDTTFEPMSVEDIRAKISVEYLSELVWLLDLGKISQATAVDIVRLYEQKIPNRSPEMIVKQFNWQMIDDPDIIEKVCIQVAAELPKVAKYFAKKGVRKPRSMLIQKAQEALNNRAAEEELWKAFEKILRKP